MDDKKHTGKWAAATGGAILFSPIGLGISAALKVSRGGRGIIGDELHGLIDGVSVDKIKASAKKSFEALHAKVSAIDMKAMEEHLRESLQNLPKDPEDIFKEGINQGRSQDELLDEILRKGKAHFDGTGETVIKNVKSTLEQIKKSKFEDIPEQMWQDLGKGFTETKTFLDAAGFKKSALGHIPGGGYTVTTAAGLLGAILAYHTVSGIEKSHAAGVKRLETKIDTAKQRPADSYVEAVQKSADFKDTETSLSR